jgi:hypothetical protein
MVWGCSRNWSESIPREEVRVDRREAMFGIPALSGLGYRTWSATPFYLNVCARHYTVLRRSDGVELGYRVRNGKMRAYVKHEYF